MVVAEETCVLSSVWAGGELALALRHLSFLVLKIKKQQTDYRGSWGKTMLSVHVVWQTGKPPLWVLSYSRKRALSMQPPREGILEPVLRAVLVDSVTRK